MSEWVTTRLGDVTTQIHNKVRVQSGETYPLLGVKWYAEGPFLRETVTSETSKATRFYRVRPGQFIYNRLFAWKGSFGLVGAELDGSFVSNEFPLFECDPERLLPEFLNLHFRQPFVWDEIERVSTGTTASRNRWKEAQFNDYRIALPPLPEQRRIVDAMAAVNAQVEALQDEVARADRVWWSMGAEMVEALAESETVRLDAIADISGGLTKNKKDFNQPDLVEVPYLRVANVHRRYLDLRVVATIQTTAAKAEALRLLPGDVLFNEGGDKDKLGRGDVWKGQVDGCIHQNHVFRARVTDPGFDPRFVSAWGNTFGKAWFETFGTQTTGIASINKRTLSSFPIPNVERVLQSRWADLLDDVVVTHNATQEELARARAMRSSLVTSLLNRDIEIPDSYDRLLEAAS